MATDNNINSREQHRTSRTLWFLYCLFLALSLVLMGRIVYLQLFWDPNDETIYLHHFQPRKYMHEIEPERGSIMDCNGKLLAFSTPMYNVNMDCTILKDDFAKDEENGKEKEAEWRQEARKMAFGIADVLKEAGKDGNWYYNLIITNRDSRTATGRKNKPIAKNIDHSTLLKLQELPLFCEGQFKSGMIIRKVDTRQYPYGELARRVIGDVKVDPKDPEANRFVGIEGQYDHILHGKKGIEWMKRTDKGMIRNVDSTATAVQHGRDIRTTIDIDIQDIADRALRSQIQENPEVQGGCIVVMEVETGAVKAMVNLSRNSRNSMGEYFNSAIGRPAEPGSVFKTVSLLTLVEDGHVELETKIPSNHGIMKEYPKLRDEYIPRYESRNKTDQISIVDGFKISSNYVFRRLVKDYYGSDEKEFIERLYEYKLAPDAYTFDLTEKGATPPYIPDPKGKGWSGTDLISVAIGYTVRQPALNIAMFYNAIANDGKMMKPYIVESIEYNGRTEKTFKPEILNGSICSKATADSVTRALKMVTLEGTASKLKNAKCVVAGKTGTARIVLNKEERAGSSDPFISAAGQKKHQGTFVGFFPADEPKYTAIVTIWSGLTSQNFYGGAYPAAAFKEIVDAVWSLDNSWGEEHAHTGKIPQMKPDFIETENGTGLPVPDLIGMGLKDAIYAIENNGYRCSYEGIGHVVKQTPASGTQYKKGQTISIVLK
jgi:cell division protein FtsI (penicillin-binding protein 3)